LNKEAKLFIEKFKIESETEEFHSSFKPGEVIKWRPGLCFSGYSPDVKLKKKKYYAEIKSVNDDGSITIEINGPMKKYFEPMEFIVRDMISLDKL